MLKVLKVFNHGFVELQSVMGTERDIVNAARTSYLGDSKGDEADRKLYYYLLDHQHHSPFEMMQLRFRIKAPVVVWWQMVRHRTASYNLQSGRYTPYEDQYYIPAAWRRQSTVNKQASEGVFSEAQSEEFTSRLLAAYQSAYEVYLELLDAGVAREMARLVLPAFALYHVGVMSINLRNFMHLVELRCAPEAQYEIRVVVSAMRQLVVPHTPWLSTYLGWRQEGANNE